MSERAWLVEWRFNGVQWLYLWPSAPGGFSFTGDASKALRFARREDAEAALQWARDTDAARRPIGSLTKHGLALGEMLVTEHDWPALTAAPSAQRQQMPEGWQLVPKVPTPQMERAAFDELELLGTPTENGTSMRNRVYRAMLAAAPALTAAPPAAQAEPLRAHLSRAQAMMQAFCDRVEVGQVRSVKTYSAFKAFLEETKP